jgi:serine/threonine protein kinase
LCGSHAVGSVGRFNVRRELGRGGFATVYLAHDPLRGCHVALKIPHPEIRHYNLSSSATVAITVTVPASRPALTVKASATTAVLGEPVPSSSK